MSPPVCTLTKNGDGCRQSLWRVMMMIRWWEREMVVADLKDTFTYHRFVFGYIDRCRTQPPSWMLTSCVGAKTPHELSTSHARHHHYKLYCFFLLFLSVATNYLDHPRCSEEIWHLFLTTGQTQRRNPLHSSWRNVLHIKWALYVYQLPWIISFKIQTSPADDILILRVVWCDDVLSSSSEKKITLLDCHYQISIHRHISLSISNHHFPSFHPPWSEAALCGGLGAEVVHMPKEGRKPQLFIPTPRAVQVISPWEENSGNAGEDIL